MSEEIQTKILAFLMGECIRKEAEQCSAVRLLFCPPSGYAEEEIGSWQRKDMPDRFEEFTKQELWAAEILQIATDHVNAQTKGRYRYVVRTLQVGGRRLAYQFAIEPAYVVNNALEISGGDAAMSGNTALLRGFETAMRTNTTMFDGTIRTLAAQNKMLADENTQLRDQNFKLVHEIEEARSTRLEREFHLRNVARKEELKEKGSQKFFQVLDLVIHEVASRRAGAGTGTVAKAESSLAQMLVEFGNSLTMEQGQALLSMLGPQQVELFYAIMRAAAPPPPPSEQQQNHAANGANGATNGVS